MKIWLDSIDVTTIAEAAKMGLIAGITTNPRILSETKSIADTLKKLLDFQPGPVAVQVTATDAEAMIDEGMKIFEYSSRFIVKIPVNRAGLSAMHALRQSNIPVMGTTVLFPSQALLSSLQGATYIAPYFSHLDDGKNTTAVMQSIVDILRINESHTKILAASVKTLDQFMTCAMMGIAAVAIKVDLVLKLLEDQPVVEKFLQGFQSDWEKTHGKMSIKLALS
jgi:TalC/MipB family fructose-6-phosphate aldolase